MLFLIGLFIERFSHLGNIFSELYLNVWVPEIKLSCNELDESTRRRIKKEKGQA